MELVKVEKSGNNLVTTSRNLADVLGKRHDNIIRDLDKIVNNGVSSNVSTLIIPSTYVNEQNKQEYRQYLLTKDGLILYLFNIQGYNDEKLAYINKFNEMEKQLQNQFKVPATFKEALMLAVEQQDHIEKLELKIQNDKARVGFAETIEKASSDILFRDMSKILANEGIKLGQNKLYSWCRGKGLILKGTLPSQRAVEQGLFRVTTRLVKTVKGDIESVTCKITGKGQVYILQKLKEELQID